MIQREIPSILLYLLLGLLWYYVYSKYHLGLYGRSRTKLKREGRKINLSTKRYVYSEKIVSSLKQVGLHMGVPVTERERRDIEYYISRLGLEYKSLGREIHWAELVGVWKVLGICIGVLGCLLAVLTWQVMYMVLGICGLAVKPYILMRLEGQVIKRDQELEKEFPDIYLVLVTRLKRGVNGSLAPTLDEYIKGARKSEKTTEGTLFVKRLRVAIELYGDEALALAKLRETYKSAMLVNFFNLAIQALKGIENEIRLETYGFELSQKQMQAMEARADLMYAKVSRAIWLVFVILAQIVIVTWAAKIGLKNILDILHR